MVAQIGPLVQVGRRKLALALHVLGGVAGGVAIGVVLGFAGLLLRAAIGESLDTVFLVVVPAALLYAAAVDLGVLNVRPITWERQTPSSWPCSLGHYPGIFAWGFDLGLGVSTRIPYQSLLVLPLAALLSGNLGAGRFRGRLRCDPGAPHRPEAPRRPRGTDLRGLDPDLLSGRRTT